MRLFITTLLSLIYLCHQTPVFAAQQAIEVDFFGQAVVLQYDDKMDLEDKVIINEAGFQKFYNSWDRTNYHTVLGSLYYNKEELHLNDWLCYRLIELTGEAIFPNRSENYQRLFSWYMLDKMGYNVRLSHKYDEVIILVYTEDQVFEMPVRNYDAGWYVEISGYNKDNDGKFERTENVEIKLGTNNSLARPFSFRLDTLPHFEKPKIIDKKLQFIHDGKVNTLEVFLSRTMMQIMYMYPEITLLEHTKVPLSKGAYMSLVEPLRRLIRGKTDYEAIRLLLSFTRQALEYGDDNKIYNAKNLTFTAEESLYYRFSDCEDRAILFHYLVKELLDLDIILLDYGDHVSTAVLLDEIYGNKPIKYKNRQYSICDPTGPGNHLKPGDYPEGLEEKDFKALKATENLQSAKK